MHTSTQVFKNVTLNKTTKSTFLLRFNSKSAFTFMVFALFFMFSNPIQAQCEDGSACAANYEPGVGNGFQTFKAKLYCSNSGAVENGLINCTTAADTDGCGIDASQDQSMVALYDGNEIYRGTETYDDLFSESPIPLNQYLQWIVFATPPTIQGTKIQAVGASDSWFLFHAGAFTTDISKATADIPYYPTVMDALTDPVNNTAFGSSDLVESSNVNQFKSWTNDNAVISNDVFNIYYIGLSYNRPTNGSLNFKVKECEIGCEPDLQCNLTNQDLICEDDFPSALNNINDIFNVIEDCGGPISLSVSDSDVTFDDSDPSNPTRTIIRTYQATANGLLVGECNQTITITDSVIEVTANNSSVCKDESVQLVGLPEGGTWSGDNVDVNGLFNATGLAANDYEVTYTFTDVNGCTNNDTATVTVYPQTADEDRNEEVCPGESFTWTIDNVDYEVSASDGVVVVVSQDANGCDFNINLSVTETPPVEVKIICDIAVCEDGVLQLAAQGIGGTGQYTFTWGPDEYVQYISNPTIGAPTFSGAPVGEYLLNVFVTDEAGCVSDPAEILITVLANPTVIVTADSPELCAGETTTVTAVPNPPVDGNTIYDYEWTVPIGVDNPGNVASFDTTVPGVYSVKITDVQATIEDIAAGCMAENSIEITPIGTSERPIVNAPNYCEGNPPAETLVNFATTTVPGASIVWSIIIDGELVELTGADLAPDGSPFAPTEAGTYIFFVEIETEDGCVTTSSSVAQFVVFDNPELSAESTNVTCFGEADGTITVNTNADSYIITLNGGDDTDLFGQSTFDAGTYTITAITSPENSDLECTSSIEVTIDEPSEVTVSAESTNVTCFGEGDGTITVTASEGATVTVNGDAYDAMAVYGPGTYTIVASAAGGNDGDVCTAMTEVTIDEPAQLICNASNSGPIFIGDDLQLSTDVSGGTAPYSYMWTSSEGAILSDSTLQNPVASNVSNGEVFTVIVTDSNGCETTCSVLAEVVELGGSETAFAAFDDDDCRSECFLDNGFKRWGWTNYITGPGSYTLNLYAGAAQCNRNKGDLAGTVTIDYSVNNISVTYNIFDGYVMDEAHVYVGRNKFPTSGNGKETVAPGQYPYNPSGLGLVREYTVSIDGNFSGGIYVIAHAVVTEVICNDIPTCFDVVDAALSDNHEGTTSFDNVTITGIQPGDDDYATVACNGPSDDVANRLDQESVDFIVSPIPFKDRLYINYEFSYDTDVVVDVYDMRGSLVHSETNSNYSANRRGGLTLNMSYLQDAVYLVRLTTNRGTLTKRVISAK